MFILISLKINVKRLSKKEEEPEDFFIYQNCSASCPPTLLVCVCVCVCVYVRACVHACVRGCSSRFKKIKKQFDLKYLKIYYEYDKKALRTRKFSHFRI